VSEARRTGTVVAAIPAGAVIGIVEVVLAISLAALVFGGYTEEMLPAGIGIYLLAAILALAITALRAGRRGAVGSVQDAATAVLAVVATQAALYSSGGPLGAYYTVVATTIVVTLSTALVFLLLGWFRIGNLARFVPYPVVGGFLAGTGWLLFKGGLFVACRVPLRVDTLGTYADAFTLVRWAPAFVFGVVLFLATRLIRRPWVIPAVLAIGFVLFAIGVPLTGNTLSSARQGLWMLGPFRSAQLDQIWTIRAFRYADWSAVADQAAGIVTTIFVAVMGCFFNIGGVEVLLRKDLDTNRELRDAGLVNVASGAVGGIPGYHALSLTALADMMSADGRLAGLVAALVPLGTIVFGASVVGYVPRMIVGGVLVFVGLSFLVAWIWDVRRSLPLGEYLIVLAIVLTIVGRGLVPGLVVGLLLAVVLFAVHYGRIDLVREVPYGPTYRSNVDRPPSERAILEGLADRIQILRLDGFIFFGTASSILERIRTRAEAGPVRYVLMDLHRVTGIDASGVLALRKAAQFCRANGAELVLAGGSDRVRALLDRSGMAAEEDVGFEPDLDHALERCEDELLAASPGGPGGGGADAVSELPPAVRALLDRRSLDAGDVLIHQGEAPDDVFVLESGRLRVEVSGGDGSPMRVGTVRPGVMVGEVAMYTRSARTADVIADVPSVVLRLSKASVDRLEADDPETAAALHRWLATTLAARLTDARRVYSAALD
jgi:sulfate permease, SulP family